MKNKRNRAVLLLLSMIIFCGCSFVRERLERLMWAESGVEEDVSYQQYLELASGDRLDEDGAYHADELDIPDTENSEALSGAVRVSFARNGYIRVRYFRDEALTDALPEDGCRLDPGDTIYASEPELLNPSGPLYYFQHFLVREYDAAGRVKRVLVETADAPGPVFRIPENFTGTEISVIPLGGYRNRIVTLSALYRRGDQEDVLENGAWEINGKRYGNGTVLLDPMGSYRVVYDYSSYKDGWYFAGSEPDSYWDRSSDGTITFLAVPSDAAQVDYKVWLHPYGSMTVGNGVSYLNPVDSILDSAAAIFGNHSVIETQNLIELLQVNGLSAVNNFSDTEITVPELRAGDQIRIRVPAELKIIADGMALPFPELAEGSREYRFSVPDREDMTLLLSVSRRNTADPDGIWHVPSVARGTLAIYDMLGRQYAEGSELPAEDEKITVEIRPDSGLCIYGKNIKDNVYREEMRFSDFKARFSEIVQFHPIRPGIMVILDTADDLGECVFWSGNEQIHGQVMLREGQDLQFDYMLRQDAGYEIILPPEDRGEAVNIWSPFAANRQLEVTDEMAGKTLRCRDFLTFKEGVSTENAVTDPF